MKLLRTFTMFALLAGSAAYADTAPSKGTGATTAPTADKKAPATDAKPAPAPTAPEISAADAEKFLAFFNKFADVMVANKDDCTKMATGLNKLIDQSQAMIKMANDSKSSGKRLPKAVEDKMMKRVMSDIAPAMQKCQGDQGVMDAMKRMDGGGAKTDAKATTPPAKTTTPPAKTGAKTDAKTDAKAPAQPAKK